PTPCRSPPLCRANRSPSTRNRQPVRRSRRRHCQRQCTSTAPARAAHTSHPVLANSNSRGTAPWLPSSNRRWPEDGVRETSAHAVAGITDDAHDLEELRILRVLAAQEPAEQILILAVQQAVVAGLIVGSPLRRDPVG